MIALDCGRLMTAPARAVLEMLAKGERRFSGGRDRIDASKATHLSAEKLQNPARYESPETTHFTIADKAGNVVAPAAERRHGRDVSGALDAALAGYRTAAGGDCRA